MSETNIPRFPEPGQYKPEGNQRTAGNNRDNNTQIGRLDRAPNEIRAEITAQRKAIRLEGEITRVNQDGSVRVQTPRGDIDVKLPADERHQQRPPQVGQRVEVEVQPPPRNAPEQPPQVTIRPAPVDTPQVQTERPSATPVQVEVSDSRPAQTQPRVEAQIVRPAPTNPNAPPPPNTFPEAGSLVRLEPVSPQQLEQLVTNRQLVVAEAAQNTLSQLPVLDVLPVQTAAAPITTSVQSTPAPLQEAIAPLAFAQTQSAPSLLLLQPTATTQNVPPQAAKTTQQVTLPPLLTALNSGVTTTSDTQINVPILTRAQAAVVQLQTLATNTPLETPPPATPQDARIGQIQPPQVSLTPPTQAAAPASPFFTPPETVPNNPVITAQKSTQITGTVIAKTEAQIPVVQFNVPQSTGAPVPATAQPLGTAAPLTPVQQQTFILQFPSDALILGSRIDVTPQSLITTSTTSPAQGATLTQATPALPFANIAFPQPWPVMQEIQQTLLQQSTKAAAQSAQAFTASIPNPANSAQFGAAALFFVAAARGGDLSSWLGDKAAEILRSSGKSSLLSRLNGDAATGRSAPDATPGEWRGMNIPLAWNGDIQKIALHYKHDSQSGDDEKASGNKGTRFIFDLNLDVMGKVQVDGFFRPVSSDGPRLDVVLRTEERFSGSMQAEMRRIYMDAIKPSQVGGELSFQDGDTAWVMIDAESESALGVSA